MNTSELKNQLRDIAEEASYNGNSWEHFCLPVVRRIERALDDKDYALDALKNIRNEFLMSDLVSDAAIALCDQAIAICEADYD